MGDDVMQGTTPHDFQHGALAPREEVAHTHEKPRRKGRKAQREGLGDGDGDGTKSLAKLGRPRTVDRMAIVKNVCRAISKGDSVKDACQSAGIRPARLHEWVREDSVLAALYARGREQQAHALAEHAIAVSRAAFGRDTAGVQAARLEVDTLKWYVGKIAPKLYGDRVTVESEGEQVVRVVFEQAVPPGQSPPIPEGQWEEADG